jgi:exodeoxyribonuclease V gamma subunit
MSGFHLITSNRLERLMESLARIVREAAPISPLAQETIIVQSPGMARWISLEMARINTIAANMVFPFPKPFVYDLFRRVTPLPESPLLSPETMTWRIMKALPLLLEEALFTPVRDYLAHDATGLKIYQLSEKIAGVFDQYLIYRPDIIMKWEEGSGGNEAALNGEAWQAHLWRTISGAGTGAPLLHHASLKARLIEAIDQVAGLPERISIFGISTLPPYYMDIFQALSRRSEVFMFYLNPCKEYWEYCYGEKEILRFSETGLTDEDQYYETGNPLLGSMGAVGREFFSLILNRVGDTGEELFEESEKNSLLSMIQNDILHMENRGKTDITGSLASDRSINISSCHTTLREIEVLHDTLISLFHEIPDLSPGDIVVMMPDVSLYAPYIQAVFDTSLETDFPKIPYAIADRSVRSANRITESFLAILSLGKNRYKASALLDVLENGAVLKKFGLTEADLILIREWINEAGISWGIDGAYKKNLGLPPFQENTFGFGMERMLLGYALPAKEACDTFMGILPMGNFEGENARIMGAFVEFAEMIFHHGKRLSEPATLDTWAKRLDGILSAFFIVDETTEGDILPIRDTLNQKGLNGYQALSGFDGLVSLDLLLFLLKKKFSMIGGGSGYIRSGVTFCTLLPMRSIPFRVVYLLGMNDGDYPRQFENPGFSLMAQKKRLCDSHQRHEDRYLFLESLLSARDRFIVSYIGQSVKDNSELPPSVLVSELMDYMESAFQRQDRDTLEGEKHLPPPSMRDIIVTRHRLHPFHADYFQNSSSLFSYSSENLDAARIHHDPHRRVRTFFQERLPEPAESLFSPIRLDRFAEFFRSPSRFLIEQRLHVRLGIADHETHDDREPFDLNALQKYQIRESLLKQIMSDPTTTDRYTGIKAAGLLPHGETGRILFHEMESDVREFSEKIFPLIHAGPVKTGEERINLSPPGVSITGRLSSCYPEGQLFFRTATLKPWDRLKTFIHHLFLNLIREKSLSGTTRLFGKEDAILFREMVPEKARTLLTDLSFLFLSGLSSPLPFSPNTSYAFAEAVVMKGKGEKEAVKAAYASWLSSDYRPGGEYDDDYHRLCHKATLPEEKAFGETALRVFSPLIEQMESI